MVARERIGFVGVGLMGHGMAKNILEKGYPLTVIAHRNRAPVDDLVARGATEAKTAKDVAANSDIVFLCVTSSRQVEEVIAGPGGLLEGAAKGMVIVDTSTADPNSTQMLAARCAEKGVSLADAPLGGTPAHAEEGALSAMVGADEATYARIEPVIMTWAAKSVHLGPTGTGHKMKLLNNFISMSYGVVYSEAMAIGARVGITPEIFDSVIRGSRMDCGFYQTFMEWTLRRDPDAHKFTLTNAHKDMRYMLSMASEAGVAAYMAACVKNAFAIAEARGNGEKYMPMLADVIAEVNGVRLRED
ncbi:MAG: NAD(P)-dependent oxidoreductase [Rhodobiaceae bacterium]|nr:NAD(P)-dependent oxidoreductase [Rhodobiaceae bacterium]MCC0053841.1 NAD(P)-dependent oxidoreductase [Rhodobiaceae bacterium]